MPAEDWNRAFEHVIPIIGTSIAAISLTVGLISLRGSSPLGQRIYYEDGRYLVAVRYPGQWNELRTFVQPDNPDVVAIYQQLGPDYWALYDFVCRKISYRRDIGEFWQTPSETLRGRGDCEDTSILLTSLLRNFNDAYVALGGFRGWGHAWVVNGEGEILEATYTEARRVPNPGDYCPYVYFNEQQVIEIWPGALGEVFELGRDEELKLELMAKELEAIA